jgi:4-carboxymuconolactone decarboxylase
MVPPRTRSGVSNGAIAARDHFVSDETFAAALAELGEQGLVDLIGCLGNFSMLATLLNAFQVDLQHVPPPYPDVRGYAKIRDNAAGL